MYLHHPDRSELDLPNVLHALSDPQRLRIVRQLAYEDGTRACYELGIDGAKSTRTHHLRVLREAGVIRQELSGTTKFNTLRREDLDACFPGLLDAVLACETASLVGAPTPGPKASLLAEPAPVTRATL
ncbi:MAG: helix-turn-helix transcriptional regulator [Solirubrobacteraceae bacterium]|jgi:DNA-binding transcriptional ArsR family regulator